MFQINAEASVTDGGAFTSASIDSSFTPNSIFDPVPGATFLHEVAGQIATMPLPAELALLVGAWNFGHVRTQTSQFVR